MRRVVVILILMLGWVGSIATAGELTPKEVTAGRKVYVGKCAKCHKFYEPKSYGEEDWRSWTEKMSRKSKLNAEQQKLLERYLDEYRAGRIAKVK
jgi:cytochrome c553